MSTIKVTIDAQGNIVLSGEGVNAGKSLTDFHTEAPLNPQTITGERSEDFLVGAKNLAYFLNLVERRVELSNRVDYMKNALSHIEDETFTDNAYDLIVGLEESIEDILRRVRQSCGTDNDEVELTEEQAKYVKNSTLARNVLTTNIATGVHKGFVLTGEALNTLAEFINQLSDDVYALAGEIDDKRYEDYDYDYDEIDDEFDDFDDDFDYDEPVDFDDHDEDTAVPNTVTVDVPEGADNDFYVKLREFISDYNEKSRHEDVEPEDTDTQEGSYHYEFSLGDLISALTSEREDKRKQRHTRPSDGLVDLLRRLL